METEAASGILSSPQSFSDAVLKNLRQWVLAILKPRKSRRLRVCETLSLGERRFVAVIEFDHQQFLVGGSGNSLELLARLHDGKVVNEPGSAGKMSTQ